MSILETHLTTGDDFYVNMDIEEIIYGGDGDDTIVGRTKSQYIYGEGGNDLLIGGLGGDILDGGAGVDTVSYGYSQVGMTVNLVQHGAVNKSGYWHDGDTLVSIENVNGSDYDDSITGTGTAN
jgi:large repetitive protein